MSKQQIARNILQQLEKQFPHADTELIYNSNFELLIAVILSAQATDKSVNKVTGKLFKQANTPEQILALGETKLKKIIQSIGLYNSKAKNIIKSCSILIEKYNAKLPQTRKTLESLPGVGRKTANVILNVAFKKPVMPVDTHIFRVANRTKIAPGKTPLEVEKNLVAIIPQQFMLNAHHLLLLHGRYVCKARKPLCSQCAIRNLCKYENKAQRNASLD